MISNGFKFAIAYVLLCSSVAQADFVSFSTWSGTSQTVGNLTLKLVGYSDNLFTNGDGVYIYTNSPDQVQLNTSCAANRTVSTTAYFEYTVEAAPGYFVDSASMSYNTGTATAPIAPMTTTFTVGTDEYQLTQPSNPPVDFSYSPSYSPTYLTVRNDFGSGDVNLGTHSNYFATAAVPTPGALTGLASMAMIGLVGVGLRRWRRR
jgi:hypothetical protein